MSKNKPPRGTPLVEDVQYAPHSRNHSQTRQERAEKAATEKALADFAGTPAAREIAALKAQLKALTDWKNSLEGRNGIRIVGSVFELSRTNMKGVGLGETSTLSLQEEGSPLGAINTLNIVGSGLTASTIGTAGTITYAFTVVDEASTISTNISKLTFQGAGVTAAAGATGEAVITIPGTPSGYSPVIVRWCVGGTAVDYYVQADPV